jgi:hypothetical protein
MPITLWLLFEHDLFRNPVAIPDQVADMLFRDHPPAGHAPFTFPG